MPWKSRRWSQRTLAGNLMIFVFSYLPYMTDLHSFSVEQLCTFFAVTIFLELRSRDFSSRSLWVACSPKRNHWTTQRYGNLFTQFCDYDIPKHLQASISLPCAILIACIHRDKTAKVFSWRLDAPSFVETGAADTFEKEHLGPAHYFLVILLKLFFFE